MSGATYPVGVIAKLLLLTERRVQQLTKEGVIPKADRGRYELAPAVQGYIRYLQERAVGREEDGSADWSKARAKHMRARAELAEIDLARAKGAVVPVEDVAAVVADEYARVRSRVMSIAPRLSVRLSLESDAAKVEAMIRAEASAALTELSEAPAVVVAAVERSGEVVSDAADDLDE